MVVSLVAEFPLKLSLTLRLKAGMEERARKFPVMSRCCTVTYTVLSKKSHVSRLNNKDIKYVYTAKRQLSSSFLYLGVTDCPYCMKHNPKAEPVIFLPNHTKS